MYKPPPSPTYITPLFFSPDFFQHAPAAAGGVPVSASAGQSTAAAAAFDQFMSDMQVELKEQEVAEEDDRQQV